MPAMLDKPHGLFREWFRKVWKLRGGGLYACGFAISFVIREVGSLADDVLGIGAIFTGQAFAFIVDFIVDSFMNTMYSFMWPVYVVQFAPPWGAIGLGLAFFGFSSVLKKPIEGWLFADAPESVEEPQK
jgi:hypothetical protein